MQNEHIKSRKNVFNMDIFYYLTNLLIRLINQPSSCFVLIELRGCHDADYLLCGSTVH